MKTRVSCMVVAVCVSAASFLAFCRTPHWHAVVLIDQPHFRFITTVYDHVVPVGYALPVLVVVGLATAVQGLRLGRVHTGLLGLTQLAFWPVLSFATAFDWTDDIANMVSGAVISIYLLTSLAFFARSLGEKSKGSVSPAAAGTQSDA